MKNIVEITEEFDYSELDNFRTKKLEGHITILKTGLPITDAYLISPSVYESWKKTRKFPNDFHNQLKLATKNILTNFRSISIRTCFKFEGFENPRALPAWRNLREKDEIVRSIIKAFKEGEEVAKNNQISNYQLGLIMMGRVVGEKGGIIVADIEKENSCMIDACWGDNLLITDGESGFDSFWVDKKLNIIEKIIRSQKHGYFFDGTKKIKKQIPKDKISSSSLTDGEIKKISKYAFKAANFHKSNVEIEFLINKEGRIEMYELQLKPGFSVHRPETYQVNENILTSGTPVFPGKVKGKVKIVRKKSDLSKIEKGDIVVVCSATMSTFLPIVNKASAIITDSGGITSHLATVAREFKIPCVVGTGNASKVLKDEDRIFVDARRGEISRGE